MHVVEVPHVLVVGTSLQLEAVACNDFHAPTAFEAGVAFLQRYGLPLMLTCDRDPRWVGSASGRDIPSVLCAFCSVWDSPLSARHSILK
ncbi:hypothetical protein KTH_63210 [Thermosporothrix hazakensis]|nr:hypothetical protein KTH_63210 [Thermosporothrix hazakensis]